MLLLFYCTLECTLLLLESMKSRQLDIIAQKTIDVVSNRKCNSRAAASKKKRFKSTPEPVRIAVDKHDKWLAGFIRGHPRQGSAAR